MMIDFIFEYLPLTILILIVLVYVAVIFSWPSPDDMFRPGRRVKVLQRHGGGRRILKLTHRNGVTYYGSIEGGFHESFFIPKYYGSVKFLDGDMITYRARSIRGLKKDFEEAINDYLEFCEEIGDTPSVPNNPTSIGEILS